MLGWGVSRKRRAFVRWNGNRVEIAIGLLAAAIITSREADAATFKGAHPAAPTDPKADQPESAEAKALQAQLDPNHVKEITPEELKALLNAKLLAALHLDDSVLQLLDTNVTAAIRKIQTALRETLKNQDKAHAKAHAADAHAYAQADHHDAGDHHIRDDAGLDHASDLLGALSPLLLLGGLAVIGGGIALAASSGGHSDKEHAPTAGADTFTTAEDTAATINVRANDSDPDGDTLTVTQVNGTAISATSPVAITGGTVSLDASGNLVFTPTANYNGSPSFSYTLSDGRGGTATATVTGTVTPVNDAPVAVADTFTTAEDTAVTINVRGNDSDVDGDTLTVTQVNGATINATTSVTVTGGVVSLNSAGNLVFTPNANYNGAPNFTYTVSDGHGGTATANVTGTVTAVNDAPIAVNDSFTVAEDTAATVNVRANDSDVDGDTLTVTQVNGQAVSTTQAVSVTGGSVLLNAAGNLVFTPTLNYNGSPSFTYTVSDGHGGTATATVSGVVTPVDDAPVVIVPTAPVATVAGTPVPLTGVSVSDSDSTTLTTTVSVDHGVLTTGTTTTPVTGGATVTGSGTGTITLTGTPTQINTSLGNVTYTPSSTYNGTDTLKVVTSDGQESTTGNFTLNVGRTIAGTVEDGYIRGATVFYDINGNGQLDDNEKKYVTTTDEHGNYTLVLPEGSEGTIVAFGGTNIDTGLTNHATLTTTVGSSVINPLTTLVVALQATGLTMAQANAQVVQALGLDAGTDVTKLDFLATPSGSTATQTANALAAQKAAVQIVQLINQGMSATGSDGSSSTQSMAITKALASAIVTANAAASAGGTTGATVNLGSTTTLQSVFTSAGLTSSQASTASSNAASINQAIATATTSAAVTQTTHDLNQSGANLPPVANDDSASTRPGASVSFNLLANDRDPEGGNLRLTQINGTAVSSGQTVSVAGGTLLIGSSGTVSFTPAAGFTGTPTFTYTVSDPSGNTRDATAHLTVSRTINDTAPVAAADQFQAIAGKAVTIDVLANDTDKDGDALTVTQVNGTAISTTQAVAVTGGSVILNSAGQIVFTADATFTGTPSFSYTLSDGFGGTATGTVNGTVTAPPTTNVAPVANPDGFTTPEDTAVTINVLGNDTDANSDSLTVTQIDGNTVVVGQVVTVTGGTVVLDQGGNLLFTPAANYNGSPAFSYTVSDGKGGTSTSVVSGTVLPVNDAPVAKDDSFTTTAGTGVTIAVTANDTDVDNDSLTVTQVNGQQISLTQSVKVSGGIVSATGNGTLVFTPDAGFTGAQDFTYTVSDGHGGTATASVSGTVTAGTPTPTNSAPVAVSDSFSTTIGTPVSVDVLGNDTDANGDTLSITQINGHAITSGGAAVSVGNGTVSLGSDGHLNFTPGAAFVGQQAFTYTVSDGHGGTATGVATATVNATSDTLPMVPGDLSAVLANGTALHLAGVNTIDVVGNNLTMSDAQASQLVSEGLHFAGDDHVAVAVAGTHASTSLKALQDLHVNSMMFTGGTGSVAAGESLAALGSTALPHFEGLNGADANVTLDLQSGSFGSTDMSTIAANLHAAGIDHLDVVNGGAVELSYAQGAELNAAHVDFTAATNVSMDVSAAQVAALGDNSSLLTALHVDHLDVTGNGIASITDTEAANLANAGVDFATGDNVTVTVAGTHAATSLKALQDLHVNNVMVTGTDGMHIVAGETLSDLASGALPHFADGVGGDANVTLDLSNGNFGSTDMSTIAANLHSAGIDHLDVVGTGPVELNYAQGVELNAAHVDFTAATNVSMDVSAAQVAALGDNSNLLTALHVDHLDVTGNGIASITDTEAANLANAGVDFATGDNVTVTVAGTHAATSLKALQDLHVNNVMVTGTDGMHIVAGETLGDLASGALPHFANTVGGDADVTLDLSSGHFGSTDMSTIAANLHSAGIDHLDVVGLGAVELNLAQGTALNAAHIDFTAPTNVTMDVSVADVHALGDNSSLLTALHVDHLDIGGNGVASITDTEAANLANAGVDFATGDNVTVTVAGTHAATSMKALQDLHVNNVMVTSADGMHVYAGETLGDLAAGTLPTFENALGGHADVTLDLSDGHFNSSLDLTTIADHLSSAGISHLDVVGTGAVTLSYAQGAELAADHIDFTSATNVTLDLNAAQALQVASHTDLLDQIHVDNLNVTDGSLAISDAQASALVTAGVDFAEANNITVNAAGTHLSTTLKGLQDLHVDSIAVASGISSLHLDAGDLSGVTAADLPHFDLAQTNAALDVTLNANANEVGDVLRLAGALHAAGIDHVEFNQALTSFSAADQAALAAAANQSGLTFIYDSQSGGEQNLVVSPQMVVANDITADPTYQQLLSQFEAAEQSHGGAVQLADGAASSLAEAGLLRAYTADTLVLDGTASGDHLLTTLKDVADLGVDQIKLADQASKPVYVDLGIQNDAHAVDDIKALFKLIEDGTSDSKVFTGTDKVALVVDADTANALSHVDGALGHLASMGFTEVDVLATPGSNTPAFANPAIEVKVIGQDDDLYHRLHHGG